MFDKMKVILFFAIFVASFSGNFQVGTGQETDSNEDFHITFDLCPSDNKAAFDNGRKCCNSKHVQWTDETCDSAPICLEGEEEETNCLNYVVCPSGGNCESFYTSCNNFRVTTTETKYEGVYKKQIAVEANRPVFIGPGGCFWWYRQYRQWLVGPCEQLGTDDGFAYLTTDKNCPYEDDQWIIRETNTTWSLNLTDIGPTRSVAGGSSTKDAGGSAGIGSISREDGKYDQNCKWILKDDRFKCIKKEQK